jgi:hypothetical protein
MTLLGIRRDLRPGPIRPSTRDPATPAFGGERSDPLSCYCSQRAPYRSTRIGAISTALQHSGLQGHEVKRLLFDLLVSKQ